VDDDTGELGSGRNVSTAEEGGGTVNLRPSDSSNTVLTTGRSRREDYNGECRGAFVAGKVMEQRVATSFSSLRWSSARAVAGTRKPSSAGATYLSLVDRVGAGQAQDLIHPQRGGRNDSSDDAARSGMRRRSSFKQLRNKVPGRGRSLGKLRTAVGGTGASTDSDKGGRAAQNRVEGIDAVYLRSWRSP